MCTRGYIETTYLSELRSWKVLQGVVFFLHPIPIVTIVTIEQNTNTRLVLHVLQYWRTTFLYPFLETYMERQNTVVQLSLLLYIVNYTLRAWRSLTNVIESVTERACLPRPLLQCCYGHHKGIVSCVGKRRSYACQIPCLIREIQETQHDKDIRL